MLRDFRDAGRALWRAKGPTAVLLFSVAAGVGANASIYSGLQTLIRGPAGFPGPDRLVTVFTSDASGATWGPSSYPDFVDLRRGIPTLTMAAAVDDGATRNVVVGDAAQSARVAEVAGDLFPALDVEAASGRLLTGDDAGADVAVVSGRLAALANGSAIVGQTLRVGRHAYEVIGVLPPGVRGLRVGRDVDVWLPMAPVPRSRGDRRLLILARLAESADMAAARDDLERLSESLAVKWPATNGRSDDQPIRHLSITRYAPVDPPVQDRLVLIGRVVAGATGLLFAGACLNAGGLVISRAVSRRRDVAIKKALGASRRTLLRLVVAESLLAFSSGAALGVLLAFWTARIIPGLGTAADAELVADRPGLVALLVALLACGLIAVACGLLAARYGIPSSPVAALRADAGGVSTYAGDRRLRRALIGAQVAVSTVLLLLTTGLITAVRHALEGDFEAVAKRVALVQVELPGRFDDPQRGVAARDRLLARLTDTPGIAAAGWASTLPLGRGTTRPFRIESQDGAIADTIDLTTNVVSAAYFNALDIPVSEGRGFGRQDTFRAPAVAIVDDLLAHRYFGSQAVGRELVDAEGRRIEVIGVVPAGRYRTLQPPPAPTVYFPATQDYLWRGYVVARTAEQPARFLPRIERVVRDAGVMTILSSESFENHLSRLLGLDRLVAATVGLSGLLALVLATIGAYAVMSDAVQRRTREIGLRLALGARAWQVGWLVLTDALTPAAAGLAAGGAAAIASVHVMRSFAAGAPVVDAAGCLVTTAALGTALALAAVGPLWRSLRISAAVALRD